MTKRAADAQLHINSEPPKKKPAFAHQRLVSDMFGDLYKKAKPMRMPSFFCYDASTQHVWFTNDLPRDSEWTCAGKIGGDKQASRLPEITLLFKPRKEQDEQTDKHIQEKKTNGTWTEYLRVKKERKFGKWSEIQIHYFKSLWQKATRRSSEQASWAAAEILAHAPLDFLRRLPVINVEDTILSLKFPKLIWMMTALGCNARKMKDKLLPKPLHIWRIDDWEADWLMNVVKAIYECPVVDRVGHDVDINVSDRQIAELKSQEQQTQLWAIKIRALYGGLKGDAKMFHAAINVWYDRWTSPETKEQAAKDFKLLSMNEVSTSYDWHAHANKIEKMQDAQELQNMWELAAVDFHCFRKFCDTLPKKIEISRDIAQLAHIEWCREHETMALQSGMKELHKETINIDLTTEDSPKDISVTDPPQKKWVVLSSGLWKRIIWNCSSSITNKRELIEKPAAAAMPFMRHVYEHFLETIRAQQCVALQRTFKSLSES